MVFTGKESSEFNESKSRRNYIKSDSKIYNFPYIDILKIDIEGAERELFNDENFLQLIKNKVKQLIIEIHYKDIIHDKIINIMDRYGFEIKEAGEVTLFNKFKSQF